MDISLLLMGLLFLAIFILPVFYIHHVQKNKGKTFLKHFTALAAKQQISIAESDLWHDSNCIGIDPNSGKLFTLAQKEGQEETHVIALNEIAKCFVSPMYRNIKGNKANKILERIDLVLTYKNANVPENCITFYGNNDRFALSNEQVLAEKWANIINDYLAKR